jgi:hypothetical protein
MIYDVFTLLDTGTWDSKIPFPMTAKNHNFGNDQSCLTIPEWWQSFPFLSINFEGLNGVTYQEERAGRERDTKLHKNGKSKSNFHDFNLQFTHQLVSWPFPTTNYDGDETVKTLWMIRYRINNNIYIISSVASRQKQQ